MDKNIIVRTSDELKTYWDAFESDYSNFMENNVFPLYSIMLNMLKAKQHFRNEIDLNILELSTGTGEGLFYLIHIAKLNNFNNKVINIYATDIAPKMLESAYQKVKGITDIGISYKDIKTEQRKINVFMQEADNEKLPFEDKYFDIVFSNLSIHLVSTPENMLRECSRVSKANTWNCFSVWGRKDESLIFTIFDDTLKKMGLFGASNVRSNFHLGQDDEALRNLILKNGYSRVNLAHSFIPFNICDPSDFDPIFTFPSFAATLSKLSSEQFEEYKKIVHNTLSEKLLDSNGLIGLDGLIILCKN
jgi:ubiquinone/menaquinone biosynthesis C-methylase UbiE